METPAAPRYECSLYERLDGGAVRCTCCSHYCTIQPNHTGICGVRYNFAGKLYLGVHGKPSDLNIDPIEKKPFYHFRPATRAFSFGTVGCSFLCSFCQNHGLSMNRPGREVSPSAGRSFAADIEDYCTSVSHQHIISPRSIIESSKAHGVDIIAFTYNEPSIWFEYARDVGILAKEEGMQCVYVSNGYASPEQLEQLPSFISAANIDLKSFREETYRKIMGGSLEPVKRTIEYLYSHGVVVEVTTLVVPGMNDSEEELREIAAYLAGISPDIPWHVSAFYPRYKMKDRKRTAPEAILQACKIGKDAGLRYVYAGNISASALDQTCCPSCRAPLVSRSDYLSHIIGLDGNKCKACGTEIYGEFGDN